MEGGTERHLPKTDDPVVGAAGECRKDVEMKQKKMKKYRIIEAFKQKHCALHLIYTCE